MNILTEVVSETFFSRLGIEKHYSELTAGQRIYWERFASLVFLFGATSIETDSILDFSRSFCEPEKNSPADGSINLSDIMPIGIAAAKLGVSVQHVDRIMRDGRLSVFQVHGHKWISLKQCRSLGIGERKKRCPSLQGKGAKS